MAAYVKIGKAVPIGIVAAITGYVLLRGEDGLRRLLRQGEPVHSNDTVSTGKDAAVTLEFADGSQLSLGEQAEALLDNQVFDSSGMNSENVAANLSALQQAILAGMDPSLLDSTAAGVGGGGGGHGFVQLARTGGEVNVSGRDFNTESPQGAERGAFDEQASTAPGDGAGGPSPANPLPVLGIADVLITEPSVGQFRYQWGKGEGNTGGHEAEAGHDSGTEHEGETGHDSGSDHGGETGHDSGSDHGGETGHDSGSDHGGETGHDSGSDHGQGGHGAPIEPVLAVFTVSLTSPAVEPVVIEFTTIDGTAIAGGIGVDGADYGGVTGSLTIAPGETEGTIEVLVYGDRVVEGTENFFVKLTSVSGAIVSDDLAVGTIIDSGHGEGSHGEGGVWIGTDGDDVLIAGGGPDSLSGMGGHDHLVGGGGPDVIDGGEGDDLLEGLGGPDVINGGEGDDILVGHGAPDVLSGGEGNDIIDGGGGPDTMTGGEGDDLLVGGGGPDTISGDEGNDVLYGDGGPDTMYGGSGDDQLTGGGGPDTLYGGEGSDTLKGGGAADILVGGEGNDILIGGGGNDEFRYFTMDDARDTIVDFKPQQGDVLNIADVLEYSAGEDIASYVQIEDAGGGSFQLMVNSSGSGVESDYQLLVTLQNLSDLPDVDSLIDSGNLVVS